MIKQEVYDKIKSASQYDALRTAVKKFLKSLKHSDSYIDARMIGYDAEPDTLLTAHSGVMNARSNRCKTMQHLTDKIFAETGIPRKPQGMYRGMDGVDWCKLYL